MKPIKIEGIKNITISGRIAAGTTTLAKNLSKILHWRVFEGGEIFAKIEEELSIHETEVDKRPDKLDLEYEEMIKKLLREKNNHIVQSHLAGFDAQGIPGVLKILLVCEDTHGNDKIDIRIDRLTNRKNIPVDVAKDEILVREQKNLEKWRRLYADGDKNWVYWNPKYYDLVVNSYDHNPDEILNIVLNNIKIRK